MSFEIVMAGPEDLHSYAEYTMECMKSSGENGIYFSPSPHEKWQDADEIIDGLEERLGKEVSETGWKRLWLAKNSDGKVVGHLDLRGGGLPSENHRCFLGVGLLKETRGQGLGQKIMETAMEWCRQQKSIDWMDLGVFHENKPAIKLYKKLGFQKYGTMRDRFRMDGNSIDDIEMCLYVGKEKSILDEFEIRRSFHCIDGPARKRDEEYSQKKVCFTATNKEFLAKTLLELSKKEDCYAVKLSINARDGMYLGRAHFTSEEKALDCWAEYKYHPQLFCNMQDDDFVREYREKTKSYENPNANS